MQTSILFKVPGKPSTRPLVILSGLAFAAQSSTSAGLRISRTLSSARSSSLATLRSAKKWAQCNCTPRRIAGALFSARVSAAFAALFLAALWWHNISITDTVEAQRALGVDCLLALPYAIAWTLRPSAPKGGEK